MFLYMHTIDDVYLLAHLTDKSDVFWVGEHQAQCIELSEWSTRVTSIVTLQFHCTLHASHTYTLVYSYARAHNKMGKKNNLARTDAKLPTTVTTKTTTIAVAITTIITSQPIWLTFSTYISIFAPQTTVLSHAVTNLNINYIQHRWFHCANLFAANMVARSLYIKIKHGWWIKSTQRKRNDCILSGDFSISDWLTLANVEYIL